MLDVVRCDDLRDSTQIGNYSEHVNRDDVIDYSLNMHLKVMSFFTMHAYKFNIPIYIVALQRILYKKISHCLLSEENLHRDDALAFFKDIKILKWNKALFNLNEQYFKGMLARFLKLDHSMDILRFLLKDELHKALELHALENLALNYKTDGYTLEGWERLTNKKFEMEACFLKNYKDLKKYYFCNFISSLLANVYIRLLDGKAVDFTPADSHAFLTLRKNLEQVSNSVRYAHINYSRLALHQTLSYFFENDDRLEYFDEPYIHALAFANSKIARCGLQANKKPCPSNKIFDDAFLFRRRKTRGLKASPLLSIGNERTLASFMCSDIEKELATIKLDSDANMQYLRNLSAYSDLIKWYNIFH